MIAYKLSAEGRAYNVKTVLPTYVPEPDEILLQVEIMPDIYILHTQEYKDYLIALDTEKQAIASAITTNLPSWTVVETSVSKISNLAEAKAFLLKLSKVVYHHLKGTTNGG